MVAFARALFISSSLSLVALSSCSSEEATGSEDGSGARGGTSGASTGGSSAGTRSGTGGSAQGGSGASETGGASGRGGASAGAGGDGAGDGGEAGASGEGGGGAGGESGADAGMGGANAGGGAGGAIAGGGAGGANAGGGAGGAIAGGGAGGATAGGGAGGSAGSMPPNPNILPNGLMIPLMGSATVGWQNATQLGGGSCSFAPVPTMTGTASPLVAGFEIVDGPNGKIARFQSALSASGSALAVIFPGPNGTLWNQADIPLTLAGGQWTGALGYNDACGGSCCSPILPVSVSYNVTIDVATRSVTLNVGGSLPAGPPPSPNACWCNRGNLNASFSGRVP